MEQSLTERNAEAEKKKKQSWGKRIDAFFDRNYAMFFAPILVIVIYLVALYRYKVFPFGDSYTIASYDLSAQICPFIEHLFDVLDGKSSLFYSYAIAGGADVTGTFLYFFVSPFSFLFLVLGDGMVSRAASIVLGCKLAGIAVAGTWFAKKLFKRIPDYICIAIGVAYAYCGYTFVSNTYINWMDFLIYLPFAVGAFKHFVKTDKFLPFSILVACCIYTCFSIACFSMFIVFPTLVAYGLLCVEKERRNKFVAYLCLAFVVALLIALPILVPALMAFLRSARGGGLFDNFWFGYTLTDGQPDVFDSSKFIDKYSTSIYQKMTYIMTDSVFVFLTLVWLYKTSYKKPMFKFMLVAGALTMWPVVVDESMLLLNMGSYMSYALRFGFLNALYFLGGACLAIEGLCYKPKCAYDGAPLFQVFKVEEMAFEPQNEWDRVALNEENGSENIAEPTGEEKEMQVVSTHEYAPFEKGNPHLKTNKKKVGWILGIAVLAIIAAVVMFFFTTGDRYKEIWSNFISDSDMLSAIKSFSSKFAHSLGGAEVVAVPFVIVGIVTLFGCILVGKKKISPRWLSFALIVVVATQVLFYNNQIVIGNRSTQHVTMGTYQSLNAQLNAMEMDENGDLAYFRVKDYRDKVPADAPFTGDANSFSVFSSVIDEDNFAIYQLLGYMGNGQNSLKSAHADWKDGSTKTIHSAELGDAFLGYKYFFVPANQKTALETDSAKKKYLKLVAEKDENGDPVLDAEGNEVPLMEDDYYIFENTIVFPNGYVLPSGEFRLEKPNEGNSSYRKANQAALYKFLRGKELSEMKSVTGSAKSDVVTYETASELSEYLWERAAQIKVGAGKITARVENASAGECLFLNFVASKGYTVTVNGKEAELIDNDIHFLSVELEEGENVVEFVYRSPYVKYMAVGAAVSIVGLCAVAFVVKKTRLVEGVAPVIKWAAVALSVVVVAFFMLYPTGAFVVKLIRLFFPA